jgi:membrane fusion protein, adhesin transport system
MSAVDFKAIANEMSGRQGSRNSIVLFVIILLLLCAGVWAYFTELDNVTRGEGRVISAMQNQIVQAAEGGVILRRYVSEGSQVSQNEVLFEIDPIDANSELNRVLQRRAALQIKEIRLRAEIAGETFQIPAELRALTPAVASSEESLFRARRTELAGAVAILEQRLVQRQQDLLGSQASIETLENTQALIAQEIAIMEPLVRQAIAPETRLLELRRELERTRGAQSGARTAETSARAGIAEIESEIRNRQDDYILASMQELSSTVADLSEIEEALPALEERVGRTIIRAPVTGVVNRLNFRTPGGYVNRGEAMLELVPTDDDLVIEARITPADISNIRLDDLVRIRFSAYDSSRYGTVDGRVIRISPDAVQNSETGQTNYLIDVAIEGGITLENGTPVVFIPGMTATVDVLSGKRTVLEYIWQPLARVQELALRD